MIPQNSIKNYLITNQAMLIKGAKLVARQLVSEQVADMVDQYTDGLLDEEDIDRAGEGKSLQEFVRGINLTKMAVAASVTASGATPVALVAGQFFRKALPQITVGDIADAHEIVRVKGVQGALDHAKKQIEEKIADAQNAAREAQYRNDLQKIQRQQRKKQSPGLGSQASGGAKAQQGVAGDNADEPFVPANQGGEDVPGNDRAADTKEGASNDVDEDRAAEQPNEESSDQDGEANENDQEDDEPDEDQDNEDDDTEDTDEDQPEEKEESDASESEEADTADSAESAEESKSAQEGGELADGAQSSEAAGVEGAEAGAAGAEGAVAGAEGAAGAGAAAGAIEGAEAGAALGPEGAAAGAALGAAGIDVSSVSEGMNAANLGKAKQEAKKKKKSQGTDKAKSATEGIESELSQEPGSRGFLWDTFISVWEDFTFSSLAYINLHFFAFYFMPDIPFLGMLESLGLPVKLKFEEPDMLQKVLGFLIFFLEFLLFLSAFIIFCAIAMAFYGITVLLTGDYEQLKSAVEFFVDFAPGKEIFDILYQAING